MVEKEVAITYETLYELLRREKSREELQEIPESFFSDIIEYIHDKKAVINSKKGDPFSDEEAEKTTIQLSNVRKILKELYDRREKKIINMAIHKARTQGSIIDTSSLLSEEKEIFEGINVTLNNYRHLILNKMIHGEPVVITKTRAAQGPPKIIESDEDSDGGDDDDDDSLQGQSTPFQSSHNSKKEASEKDSKVPVMFTTEVPEFIGTDMINYGPFNKGDIAELPVPIAQLLINSKQALTAKKEEKVTGTKISETLNSKTTGNKIVDELQSVEFDPEDEDDLAMSGGEETNKNIIETTQS